jgi:hypothetical protein
MVYKRSPKGARRTGQGDFIEEVGGKPEVPLVERPEATRRKHRKMTIHDDPMMNRKGCYGVLDRVFPLGAEGRRQVPPECLECPDRVSCLKEAITTKEGLEMRTQLLERAEQGGLIGRFQRWSQKKHLSRQIRERKEK